MSERNENRKWLIAEWANQLRQVLESMTGQKPELEWTQDSQDDLAIAIGWEQSLNPGAGCVLWAGATEVAWRQIATTVLGAAGVEGSEADELRSTYLEILSQANSATAQKIGERIGREVVTLEGREVRVSPGGMPTSVLAIQFPGNAAAHIHFALGPGVDWLFEERSGAASPAVQAEEPPETGGSKTLDLLLDVELPVSVSFGRAQLPLKDVLKLTTGSIVELNRSIIEPVEIIVNNCVIARGEVVVIEGNYGVRITHVISRQERFRTLH